MPLTRTRRRLDIVDGPNSVLGEDKRRVVGAVASVATIFFAAVCAAAALFVLAALSLSGAARAGDAVASTGSCAEPVPCEECRLDPRAHPRKVH